MTVKQRIAKSARDSGVDAYPDDEVTLLDLVEIIWRHRWLGCSIFFIVMMSALSYTLLVKPVYLSKSVIGIGNLPELAWVDKQVQPIMMTIESPEFVVKRLHGKYTGGLPALNSIVYDKRNLDLTIDLTAVGNSPEQAQAFLQEIVHQLLAEHAARYESVYSAISAAVESKQKALTEITDQIQKLSKAAEELKTMDSTQSSLLIMRIGLLTEQKMSVLERYDELKIKLDVKLPATQVLQEPTLARSPHKPKVRLILGLGFVFGICAAIAVIIFAQFLAYVRNYIKQDRV
jgi:uncharacterized protein involved in exopolysaccharide biosynthesis